VKPHPYPPRRGREKASPSPSEPMVTDQREVREGSADSYG